jgi:alkylated DNA repair dioxygenase AlkB
VARIELPLGAFIDLEATWLSAVKAAALQEALTTELAWEQRHIVLFGKPILQPRLIAWMGELPYRYSGQTLPPRPWPPNVAPLLGPVCSRVNEAAATPFNHVLVNRYRDGNDSMGYHADDEPELGEDPVVACVSLGRSRKFVLKSRSGPKQPPLALALEHGSLLVMGGTCQRHYRHAILRERDPGTLHARSLERISLTFRHLLRAPDEPRASSLARGREGLP